MQTFLPYPSFVESARVLDNRRLGKQRVEAWQILRTLRGETRGWVNHPAVRMWRGFEKQLACYGWTVSHEWTSRGYKDSLTSRFAAVIGIEDIERLTRPPWLGDPVFHRSHQSNLVRKDPVFYSLKFPGVPPDLPYVWPI